MGDPKAELIAIVGEKNVLDDTQTLEGYSTDRSFSQGVKPQLIIRVENVDEVQKIIEWANETGTPLVPVSSGPPHFHGDTLPGVPGAVIVDLSGMKQILKVDRRNRLAFVEAGVTYGEEVIVPAYTFIATATACLTVGAIPVFADVDPSTYNIAPEGIEHAITPRTKAIIPVHIGGCPADMDGVLEVAGKHNLLVIEDGAQSIDAHGEGFRQGEHSDVWCTSFIIQKNLGTFGDGGLVATNNSEVDEEVRKLRNHGSSKRSYHSMGYNSRLDDLHAGVLSAKLKHITAFTGFLI